METLGQSPFVWLEFDKHGAISSKAVSELKHCLQSPGIRDLVILSHGWKNTFKDARALYETLWKNTCDALPKDKAKSIAVAGIVWPAAAFRTDFDDGVLTASPEGKALGLEDGTPTDDMDVKDDAWTEMLSDFDDFIGGAGKEVIAAAHDAGADLTPEKCLTLVQNGIRAIEADPTTDDPELKEDAGKILSGELTPDKAYDILSNLIMPLEIGLEPDLATTLGVKQTLKGVTQGARAAVGRFLNQLTYYGMKKRAGEIGVKLALNVLATLKPPSSVRLHLVGHSFGARLVTAAANALQPPANLPLFSITLLQGAFSHNGLAGEFATGKKGAFPNVIRKPEGPIAITYTHNDVACTVYYAIASRLARDMTQKIGDPNDPYGAIGANGPQHLPEGTVIAHGTSMDFKPRPGKVNTFQADSYIVKTKLTDAHNNVTNSTVGQLLAAVIQ